MRRAAAGAQRRECTGKQGRLDARQRTHVDDDPLDGIRTSIGGNFNDLCQQGLANGELVQMPFPITLRTSMIALI
jgi:hypothetical protein